MIIVTASDERYFELAKELILSIKACWPAPVPIGFVDLGVRPQQRAWLVSQGVLVEPPRTKFNLDRLVDDASSKIGYLARPFINEIFSGHAMYVWLDADVWLQSWDGIQRLHDGAAARGAAMARENEKAYRWWMWMYAGRSSISRWGSAASPVRQFGCYPISITASSPCAPMHRTGPVGANTSRGH